MKPPSAIKKSVVTVGDGRGFVVERDGTKFVITAAHCLPHPPKSMGPYPGDEHYSNLLGPLGDEVPPVWTQPIFVDLVSDLAILGEPDDQSLFKQHDQWLGFMEKKEPIPIRQARLGDRVYMLSLDGQFVSSVIRHFNEQVFAFEYSAPNLIKPGMSGSPILSGDGCAVSVCSVSSNMPITQGLNLPNCLPVWFRAKRTAKRKARR